jgi:hypothetical protein
MSSDLCLEPLSWVLTGLPSWFIPTIATAIVVVRTLVWGSGGPGRIVCAG